MQAVLLCLAVGLCWGGSALVGRLSSAPGIIMPVLVALGGAITVLPIAFRQNYVAAGSRAIWFGLLAGIINGLGVLAFFSLVAGARNGQWEISKVLPAAYVLVSAVIVVGARIFFGETITGEKMIGLACVLGAVWFLR